MADAFVGAVVHIHKPRFPVGSEGLVVNRESVVLRGDEAAVRADHTYRLVMTAVPVLQFIGVGTPGSGEQLVAHAYSENRLVPFHRLAKVGNRDVAELRVARPVGDEQPVVVELVEIVVPRHPDDLHSPFHEAPEDVVLDSAVNHHDCLGAAAIFNHILAADDGDLVGEVRVVDREILLHAVRNNHSKHRALLAEKLRDGAGVDSEYSRNLLLFQPLVEALDRIPVAVVEGIVAYDDSPHPDLL